MATTIYNLANIGLSNVTFNGSVSFVESGNNIVVTGIVNTTTYTTYYNSGYKYSGNIEPWMEIVIDGVHSSVKRVGTYHATGAAAGSSSPSDSWGGNAVTVTVPKGTGNHTYTVNMRQSGASGTIRASASGTFTSAPQSYTVAYNGNGADGGATASQEKQPDVALTIADNGFTRTGYVFVEWNTSPQGDGVSYAEGASYTGNANLTLYAIWKKANIPVYVNVGGAIYQVEKAYANIGGVIKECAVYANVNGVIKELI